MPLSDPIIEYLIKKIQYLTGLYEIVLLLFENKNLSFW